MISPLRSKHLFCALTCGPFLIRQLTVHIAHLVYNPNCFILFVKLNPLKFSEHYQGSLEVKLPTIWTVEKQR